MEELMQYVWQYRLWPTADMLTVDGRRVEVLDTGTLNRNAGPDFFNAKVQIAGQMWIGDIEIHVKASDWFRHGHNADKAYDSVILHVVQYNDMEIARTNGEIIPQMIMTCARDFSQRYHNLVNDPIRDLPCSNEISSINPIYITDTLTALAYERMYEKCDRILEMLRKYSGNWTETIYETLSRALGFNTNSEPFQLLARTTPLKHLLRHSDSLLSLEAILFGQAGLLNFKEIPDDHYVSRLVEEYNFMSSKFGLKASENINWKFARMRPQNFPHRRIATLAAFIHRGFPLSSKILSVETEEEARNLFDIELHGYWSRHFNFSPSTSSSVKAFSYSSITGLMINVVIPLQFAYALTTGNDRKQESVIDLLQSLHAENNSIVQIFQRAGIPVDNAFSSQAIIHLRKEYCSQRKCLFCRIGHLLLSRKVKA